MTTGNAEFDREKVLGRVKKMMALANDAGASEGERENALRMAHATLAKYNLTMSEAERSGKSKDSGEARKGDALEGRDYPWMRTSAYAVAQLYFCEYFYVMMGNGKLKHFFVGRESNVYTAKEMTQYVINSIDREAQRVARERTINGALGSLGTFWRSFCKGAAHSLYIKCLQLRQDAEKESQEEADEQRELLAGAVNKAPGTALVLASVYEAEKAANVEFMKSSMGINNLQAGRDRQRNTSWDAHAEGREYGKRINLNKQIGSGSNPRLKGDS